MPKAKSEVEEHIYLPEKDEVLGIVDQMFGNDRVRVRCRDGKIRNCRIPGKLRKRVWILEGDVVAVKPWAVQGGERGDIVYRYTKTQVERLRKMGLWE
jgi:translation initiation factor 1A